MNSSIQDTEHAWKYEYIISTIFIIILFISSTEAAINSHPYLPGECKCFCLVLNQVYIWLHDYGGGSGAWQCVYEYQILEQIEYPNIIWKDKLIERNTK